MHNNRMMGEHGCEHHTYITVCTNYNYTHRLTSIRVVDAHGKVIIIRGGFERKDDTITTDTEITIAQLFRLFRSQGRIGAIAIVNENEIISQAFVFGKINLIIGSKESCA